MKTLKYIFLLILLLKLSSANAQTFPAGKASKYTVLDSIFSSLYQTDQFSGSVLIAEKGEPVYEKSFGVISEETRQPINSNTMFLLASVSKQFTAMGIVILKQEGKLNYDDLLVKYLPNLPYNNITIRQVLTHTSGIPDYISLADKYWDKAKYANNRDIIDLLVKYHPNPSFAPGERYEYSNTGYVLLASVIEKISGSGLAEFMQKHIFQPLKMTRTMVYTRRYHPQNVTNYALGYVYDDSLKHFVLPDAHPAYKNMIWEDGVIGEDGVNSTTGDMLKWDRALYTDKLVPQSALADIFSPGKVAKGETDYGFGWHIKTMGDYGKVAFHSGGWPGYMVYIERHLDNDKTIIILRNKYTPATRMPLDAIRAVLYNKPVPQKIDVPLPDSLLIQYTGVYALTDKINENITKEGHHLKARITGQPPLDMAAQNNTTFYIEAADAKIEFVKDSSGKVIQLVLFQRGNQITAKKIQ